MNRRIVTCLAFLAICFGLAFMPAVPVPALAALKHCCLVDASVPYRGFPIPMTQPLIQCATHGVTTLPCPYATTPPPGDFLIATVEYPNEVGNTFTPPAGWTQVFTADDCFALYTKTASGSDTGFTATQTSTSRTATLIMDFTGSHSVNSHNVTTTATPVPIYPAAPLTSPTPLPGSGIITMGASGNQNAGQAFLNSSIGGRDWSETIMAPSMNASYGGDNEYDQWVIGFWQGTYGTDPLFWPTFLFGGTAQSAYNLSVGPPPSLICSETLSIL